MGLACVLYVYCTWNSLPFLLYCWSKVVQPAGYNSALRCCVYIPGCLIALWYPMYVCVMRWVSYIHVCCALINRGTKATHAVYSSGTGTRTRVSCVKGKYASHLHHTGSSFRHRPKTTSNITISYHTQKLTTLSAFIQ